MSEHDLRRMLEKATVRLEILRGRMEACDADSDEATHELSRWEIDGWVDEQRALLNGDDSDPTGYGGAV